VAVGSLAGSANFGGDVGTIASTYAGSREGLVLVLDAATGKAKFAALMGSPYQYARASKGVLVATTDTDIYVACAGPCNNVHSGTDARADYGGVMMGSTYKGGMAKFGKALEPKWISELPTYPQGMAAMTGTAVYVNYYASNPETYGEDTFSTWVGADDKDQFIMKFNPDTGKGEWVMQQGGLGKEYVRRMAMDMNGDIYTTGKSGSNPGYFDNVLMTEHDASNKNDMFLAKLATSSEKLPACKSDETNVKGGFCFFQNTCFPAEAAMMPGDVICKPDRELGDDLTSAGSSFASSLVVVTLGMVVALFV